MIKFLKALTVLLLLRNPAHGADEDGYQLWLRYRPLDHAAQTRLRASATSLVLAAPASPTTTAALAELQRGVGGMLGGKPGRAPVLRATVRDGAIVLARPAGTAALSGADRAALATLGKEGYLLRSTRLQGHNVTLIAANTDIGLLYGSYAWLRAIGTGAAEPAIGARIAAAHPEPLG